MLGRLTDCQKAIKNDLYLKAFVDQMSKMSDDLTLLPAKVTFGPNLKSLNDEAKNTKCKPDIIITALHNLIDHTVNKFSFDENTKKILQNSKIAALKPTKQVALGMFSFLTRKNMPKPQAKPPQQPQPQPKSQTQQSQPQQPKPDTPPKPQQDPNAQYYCKGGSKKTEKKKTARKRKCCTTQRSSTKTTMRSTNTPSKKAGAN